MKLNRALKRWPWLQKKDFAWKVRWRMRHDRNERFIMLQDKYLVKEFAASRGVRAAEVLYLTDQPSTTPFDRLPPRYFLKANHGSCWNILHLESGFYLFGNGARLFAGGASLPKDEASAACRLTREQCIRQCETWLGRKYSTKEWAYQHISPKIVVEEFLESADGPELRDYRCYTFDGVVKAMNVCSAPHRSRNENFFCDPDWKEFTLTKYKERRPATPMERPANLKELVATAEKLGKGLDFVRIDLYHTTRGVMLGEMTLYPERGGEDTPTACPVFNQWLGDQWVLNRNGSG